MSKILHQNDSLTKKNGEKLFFKDGLKICPICGHSSEDQSPEPIYKFGAFSIIECEKCHTKHLSPLPSQEDLREIYNNNYYHDPEQEHGYYDYDSETPSIEQTYLRRVSFLKKHLKGRVSEKLSVLEIGCALGAGMSALAKQYPNWEFTGADISEDAEQACKQKGLSFLRTNNDGTLDTDKKFDVILLFDLIEHLTDIPNFVNFLNTSLNKGGMVVITTPDMNSFLNKALGSRSPSIKIPQHTIYFDEKSLTGAMGGRFQILDRHIDYQSTSFSRLAERLSYILFSRTNTFKIPLRLWVPNGMKIYIFKKV